MAGRSGLWSILPILLLVALLAVGATLAWQRWPSFPADDSVDAGFARDMAVHHAQAVDMALIEYDRTENEAIKYLATDIVQSQSTQRGMMLGWLTAWGLPSTSTEPTMAWMGHPMSGPMPGMATQEEIEQLRTLPQVEADALFLRLMIRHHQGGLEMAQAAVQRADEPEVRTVAAAIVAGQTSEIQQMQDLLGGIGRSKPGAAPDAGTLQDVEQDHSN